MYFVLFVPAASGKGAAQASQEPKASGRFRFPFFGAAEVKLSDSIDRDVVIECDCQQQASAKPLTIQHVRRADRPQTCNMTEIC